MALNTGYVLRTGEYEPAKKTKSNNNETEQKRTPQEEAEARYKAVKVLDDRATLYLNYAFTL